MKQGLNPKISDHRDYDFHKSFGTAQKPTEYIAFSVDGEFPVLNQNGMGLPWGCTGFAQGYLCSCEDKVQADPAEIYINTPPYNKTSGRNIRDSLNRIKKVGYRKYLTEDPPANPRTAYYSCRAQGILDWFDAIYVAMLVTKDENRAMSIGVPWFPEFESVGSDGILPMPQDFNVSRGTWHNAAIGKVILIGNEPYFGIQSWQGSNYGHNGWCYMNRALANKIFDIYGTEAFTVTKLTPQSIQAINLDVVEWIVNLIRGLLGAFNGYLGSF